MAGQRARRAPAIRNASTEPAHSRTRSAVAASFTVSRPRPTTTASRSRACAALNGCRATRRTPSRLPRRRAPTTSRAGPSPAGSNGRTWVAVVTPSTTTRSRRPATSERNRPARSSALAGTSLGATLNARSTRASTSLGVASARWPTSTKTCPSGKSAATSCAARTARAVLPLPAAPVTSTGARAGPRRAATTSAVSRARPTNVTRSAGSSRGMFQANGGRVSAGDGTAAGVAEAANDSSGTRPSIARCRSLSCCEGSTPSCSVRTARASRYAPSAADGSPERYRASMSCPQARSRNGCAATWLRNSASTCACWPAASRASVNSSKTWSRCSSRLAQRESNSVPRGRPSPGWPRHCAIALANGPMALAASRAASMVRPSLASRWKSVTSSSCAASCSS